MTRYRTNRRWTLVGQGSDSPLIGGPFLSDGEEVLVVEVPREATEQGAPPPPTPGVENIARRAA